MIIAHTFFIQPTTLPIKPLDEWLKKVQELEPNLLEDRAKNVALIEHMDYSFGRIMDYLKQTGSLQNTLIISTSDNGGALRFAQSNGKLRGGKKDMYEGGIRVPTSFFWPEHIEARVTDQTAILTDIFLTICTIANLKTPSDINRVNLLPVLTGQSILPNDRLMVWMRREGDQYGGLAYYGARRGSIKLVQNTPFEPIQF